LAAPGRYGVSENRALDSGEAKVVDLLADPNKNKVRLAEGWGGGGLLMAVIERPEKTILAER